MGVCLFFRFSSCTVLYCYGVVPIHEECGSLFSTLLLSHFGPCSERINIWRPNKTMPKSTPQVWVWLWKSLAMAEQCAEQISISIGLFYKHWKGPGSCPFRAWPGLATRVDICSVICQPRKRICFKYSGPQKLKLKKKNLKFTLNISDCQGQVHICNPSIWEAEPGGLGVQGKPGLYIVWPCFQMKLN